MILNVDVNHPLSAETSIIACKKVFDFQSLKIHELLNFFFYFLPVKYVWSDPKPISNQCNNQSKVESILRNELEATEKFWYLDFPYFCYKLFPKDTTWPDLH